MKKNLFTFLILLIVFALGACSGAPAASPTLSSVDVQNTAIAAAFTIIAQTHEALPSITLAPPTAGQTQTPLPTNTTLPTDTPSVLLTDTATSIPLPVPTFTATVQSSGDPCNAPLKSGAAGGPTKIKLVNKTNAPVTASIYLNITPFGECGYRGYNLSKGDAITITDVPQGCYSVSVYVNDPKKPTKSFGYGCINNPDLWIFEIYRDYVKFIGP